LGAPTGVTVDPAGNLYFAEQINDVIRMVNSTGNINPFAGCNPPTSACLLAGLGNGGPATGASLNPVDVVSDKLGNIYFTDSKSLVRKVSTSGILSTVAGNGTATYSGDGVAATSVAVNDPIGMAFDSAGNLYIADTLNNRIRKVSAATGIISTFAGNGTMGFGGDGAAATTAALANPHSIAFDSAGNLYISDTLNHRIRMVDMNGHINTIAGNGMVGNTGDGGPAINASMTDPWGIAVDSSGNIYFADWLNNSVRKINAAGVISTIAGGGKGGLGDGGPATIATLFAPEGIALDGSGNLYIADYSNNRIRKVSGVTTGGGGSTTPVITSVGNAESGSTIIAPNTWVEINGANLAPSGDIRDWGAADFVNNQLPTSLDGVSVTVNGVAAYVYYISPTQINILTPPEPIQGSVMVQLTTAGVASAPFPVQAQIVSPSLFVFNGGPYVAAEHGVTYGYIGPTTLYPGLTTPAAPGETIMIYGNGFGVTSVNVVAGSETQSGNLPTFPIVTIGGQPAMVAFAGLVFPGEYLFNVVVPGGLADGDHAVTMMYGGVQTQAGVLLTTKAPN
jgi:uncharacterized protein (TIGR03437 family)